MRNVYISFSTLLFFSFSQICLGQFEGRLSYKMVYSSANEALNPMLFSLPLSSTLLLKDSRVRFTQPVAGGGQQAFVSDTKLGTSTLLMNFLGQEFQVKIDKDDMLELEQTKTLKIVEGEKTKTIAGLECRQAFALSGKDTLEVYYAPDIEAPAILPQFENLRGLPLQYEIYKGDLHIRYTCTSILEEPIADSYFEISASVREIPFSAFAKSFAVAK